MIGGLIFALGWPLNGFPLLLFFGFIPFLWAEDYLVKHKDTISKYQVFFIVYPGFFVFNTLTTYWIFNSTAVGGIGALLLNSLFMTLAFSIFHLSKRAMYKAGTGHFLLLFYWVAFEYFHLDWDLSWPWLNLGNGFANWHKSIQWYEYTGSLGGSFWIVLVNILFYLLFRKIYETKKVGIKEYQSLALILVIIIAPIIVSKIIYSNYTEQGETREVVIVQPNLDPYSEQYGLNPSKIMDRIFTLADQKIDSTVDFLVCPESANQEHMFENVLSRYNSMRKIRTYIKEYPQLNIVIGASTYNNVFGQDTLTNAARKYRNQKGYYFEYNAAIFADSSTNYQLYHKSKLAPGVELMPSWRILRPLEKLAINLGGTIGTLATDDIRKNFITKDSLKIATVICYESVYGEFVSRFVKNGAKLIFVITNDGWWGNTPGHKQHFIYSKIRAIENRRCIARSANTGISAFYNQRGDVLNRTEYWKKDAIRHSLTLNNEITFYTANGDFIARISALISILFILVSFTRGVLTKRQSLQ